MRLSKKTKQGLVIVFLTLSLTTVSTLTAQQYSKDYHSELTASAYNDTIKQNDLNLVFYKKGCPYCEAGMTPIKKAAKQSNITTFYIDVDSQDGKELVNRYHLQYSANIVQIRNGIVTVSPYAYKVNNHIVADTNAITKAFQAP